ncbi:unnamed protein product, partial [Musa textilis]
RARVFFFFSFYPDKIPVFLIFALVDPDTTSSTPLDAFHSKSSASNFNCARVLIGSEMFRSI